MVAEKLTGVEGVAFKIDHHAYCDYFNFTFQKIQLGSDYLITLWIVSARMINFAALSFKGNQFICHLDVHVCTLYLYNKNMQNTRHAQKMILVK